MIKLVEDSTYASFSGDRYEEIESYRDLWMRNLLFLRGSRPRSSRVLQSTEPAITFQRQSTSVRNPRNIGDAADSANYK